MRSSKKAHSLYLTVRCAISARGIIGPYFFENSEGIRETERQTNYQHMIENYFVPKLKELVGSDFESQIFMQDGASPHSQNHFRTPEEVFWHKNLKLQI